MLRLDNDTSYHGNMFASDSSVCGELVFNTGMTGYIEALTDPSYRGQILVLSYPLVGNYGVPNCCGGLNGPFQSEKIQVAGLVVQDYVDEPSHFASQRSLGQWLTQEGVPALTGINTRALVLQLREGGTQFGCIDSGDNPELDPTVYSREALFESFPVRDDRLIRTNDTAPTVLVVDYGVKYSLLNSLTRRGVNVNCVDWRKVNAEHLADADAVVISSGPGDPAWFPESSDFILQVVKSQTPLLGVCLGHQLICRAFGMTTYKLGFGHRGSNHPVQDVFTRQCYVTSQNHGYAVAESSKSDHLSPWFVNLNDGSNEGMCSLSERVFTVQFHPEASPGPLESGFIFDDFLRAVQRK